MATSGPDLDGGAPFTDWREQLRDRVKEIRARKLAGKRNGEETDDTDLEAQAAARAEKLRSARAQVADPATGAALIDGDRAQRRADIADVVDAFLPPMEAVAAPVEEPVEVAAAPPVAPRPAAAEPPADAPLFDPEDEVLSLGFDRFEEEEGHEHEDEEEENLDEDDEDDLDDEDEDLDDEDDEDDDLDDDLDDDEDDEDDDLDDDLDDDEEEDEEDALDEDYELGPATSLPPPAAPAIDPLASAPAWARAAFGGTPAKPAPAGAPTASLDELKIPAWAKPRARPANSIVDDLLPATPELDFHAAASARAPEPDNAAFDDLVHDVLGSLEASTPAAAADVHLVGEYRGRHETATPEPAARIDIAPIDPAQEAPRRRASLAELFDREPVQLSPAPPVPVFDHLRAASPPEPEPTRAGAPWMEREWSDRSVEATHTAAAAGDVDMDWDLATPANPDTILDAQREHDPSAPVSDRVFSTIADALVLLTIGALLLLAGANTVGTPLVPFLQATPIPLLGTWLVFALGYGIFFTGTCGQTLGKMAMRVRVIGVERFAVSYGQAAGRAVGYALAMLPVGLGLLPALRDPEHRALHDRLSGTRVVKA